jgi:hypothetical protein
MSTTTPEMFPVDYDLHDCPWTELELQAFYELANRDIPPLHTHTAPLPQKQQHHLLTNQDTQLHTVPAPHLNPVHQHFHSQMQFKHKVVVKGPKLAFPEFEGTDPDGWIRKAEKFFELVVVPSEDKVKIAVMYWKGKADYWWRGTGCTPVALPWHHFCRMLEDRFLEIDSVVTAFGP